MDERILNKALELALEWGKNWMAPIQPRLAEKFPDLSPAELDDCDRLCRKVMDHAWKKSADLACLVKAGKEEQARAQWRQAVTELYPWCSDENLAKLANQGNYYAWKDGLL